MKSSSSQDGELNCSPPTIRMTGSPTPLPVVLLFIGIIFYVFEYVIVNNGYKFVIFGDSSDVEYQFANDHVPIPRHTSHSSTIEFISIYAGIPGNNDFKYEFDVIQDENSIDSKTLSGM